jgi:hypothetical protein
MELDIMMIGSPRGESLGIEEVRNLMQKGVKDGHWREKAILMKPEIAP